MPKPNHNSPFEYFHTRWSFTVILYITMLGPVFALPGRFDIPHLFHKNKKITKNLFPRSFTDKCLPDPTHTHYVRIVHSHALR